MSRIRWTMPSRSESFAIRHQSQVKLDSGWLLVRTADGESAMSRSTGELCGAARSTSGSRPAYALHSRGESPAAHTVASAVASEPADVAPAAAGRLPGLDGVSAQVQVPGSGVSVPETVRPARQPTSSVSLTTSPRPTLDDGLVPLAQLGSSIGEDVTLLPGAALLPHQQ